jgi:hypothetical protein
MEIKEVSAEKGVLEKRLVELMNDFEQRTGAIIIALTFARIYDMYGTKPKTIEFANLHTEIP